MRPLRHGQKKPEAPAYVLAPRGLCGRLPTEPGASTNDCIWVGLDRGRGFGMAAAGVCFRRYSDEYRGSLINGAYTVNFFVNWILREIHM